MVVDLYYNNIYYYSIVTKVSKYPVHKDVEKRMFEVFKDVIASLHASEDIEDFLNDFLSPVERIMLAKRLSIAVLLGKGYSYDTISSILRVTPITISSVSVNLKYSGKGYKKVVERILNDEKKNEFWEKIEDMLAIIPPSKGTNMVKFRAKYNKEKRERRKAF